MSNELNEKVKSWWNSNPYTYGMSKKDGYRDVGDVTDTELDGAFFDHYMRKSRKHFRDAQRANEPLAARFIQYDFIPDKRVLDIAVGFGWSTVEMARAGANVTGIDLTARAVEATQKHLELRGLTAEVRQMDAQQMEFPDATFDYVLAWGCLMHMPDTEKAISEIYRVLKPGGRATAYMYNKNSVSYWWNIWFLRGVLLGRLWTYRGDTTRLVSRFTDGITIGGNALTKVYTPREAETMFKKVGFAQAEAKPWGPPQMIAYFPITKLPLGRLLSDKMRKKIADRWGWGMIIQVEKSK